MASSLPPGLPRAVEVVLGAGALVVLLPGLALAAAAIKIDSPGPVLFKQTRVGRRGKPFALVKLRTMTTANTGLRVTAGDDPRITRVGGFLRRTKIDELPELWNLLKGDISLVGPRPEVLEYVDVADPLWASVLEVRPGITDPVTLELRREEELLRSVRGDRDSYYRNVLLPYKLRGNLHYLKRRSWTTDIEVIVRTMGVILAREKGPSSWPAELLKET